jgi:P pilus assembly chaperone PapD
MKILIVSVACLLSPALARAMNVSPMTAELDPSGRGSSAVYTVENESAQPLAVECWVEARATAADGTEASAASPEAKKMFSIFPAALIVPPGQKRGVRVAYTGPKDIASELAFRVVFAEVPAKASIDEARGVRVTRQFRTSAYVRPRGARPDLRLTGVGERGGKVLLKLKNEGSAHQLPQRLAIKLADDSGATAMVDERAAKELLANFLSGEPREILVDKPPGLGKVVKGSLEKVE